MIDEIALLVYMLVCIAFRWRNVVGWRCFCKDEDLGRKQPELPWCRHETISLHLGLNSRDLEIRRGVGEGGGDLEGCKSAGFPGPVFFFTASFSLSFCVE